MHLTERPPQRALAIGTRAHDEPPKNCGMSCQINPLVCVNYLTLVGNQQPRQNSLKRQRASPYRPKRGDIVPYSTSISQRQFHTWFPPMKLTSRNPSKRRQLQPTHDPSEHTSPLTPDVDPYQWRRA